MLFLLLNQQLRKRAGEVPSFGKFIRLLEILLFDLILMGVIYGISEHKSWFDSMWLVWQTSTTVGYGDIPPVTKIGRWGVMICGTVGILLLSYVVGSVIEYLGESKRRRQTGMEPNKKAGGTLLVCCRDRDRLVTFIKELRCVSPDEPICIVDDQMEELPKHVAGLKDVHFVRGSVLNRKTYAQAGIAECKRIFVFPHQPGLAASDGMTENIVTLTEKMAPADTTIIHFLVDAENEDLFERSRSKPVYADFDVYAAIQECQDAGSAEIFSTLMSNSHGANPTTFYPTQLKDWTWGEIAKAALQYSQDTGIPVNPLALITKGKSNPCPDANSKVVDGDALSLIVHRTFSYPEFESAVVKRGKS